MCVEWELEGKINFSCVIPKHNITKINGFHGPEQTMEMKMACLHGNSLPAFNKLSSNLLSINELVA